MPALKLPDGEIVDESAAILLADCRSLPAFRLACRRTRRSHAHNAYRWIAFMASEIYPMAGGSSIIRERFAPTGSTRADALLNARVDRVRERFLIDQVNADAPDLWLLISGFLRCGHLRRHVQPAGRLARIMPEGKSVEGERIGRTCGFTTQAHRAIWQRHFCWFRRSF